MKPKFMRAAIRLSIDMMRCGKGGPFGAVVVKRGKIVGRGCNEVTSTNDPTAHAEIVAIRDACRRLKTFCLEGCDLYTSCEPCPMCLAAIYWARCAAIFYGSSAADAAAAGFDDAFLYAEIKRPINQRKIPTVNLLPEKAIASFNAWLAQTGRIDY